MASYAIDGHRVSKPWHIVLTHARRMGVDFSVNDGRRTLAVQWARVRKHGLWSPANPTGAARPTLGAPHINWGRCNHAIDANAAVDIATFLHRKGCKSVTRPIVAEPWHLQIGHRDLLRLARRIERERKANR
jgi:hypothetical protein